MKKVIVAENVLNAVGKSSTVFGRGSITVYPAKTSEDILVLHKDMNADLIITDFSLPVMGGAKLVAAIREHPSMRGVSIIVACDRSKPAVATCAQVGANAVLLKPVDALELFAKMSELVLISERKAMRVLLRVAVKDSAASFFANSENISISGMLLEANYAFKTDDLLSCSFFVGHAEISVEGRVMRVERTVQGKYRCGVRFVNPDTKALVIIEQYVKAQRRAADGQA